MKTKPLYSYLLISWMAFVALFFALPLSAAELKWNGFIAQGVQQADGSNFVNQDGDVSLALTEIGINGRWNFDEHVSVNGQAYFIAKPIDDKDI